MKIFHQDRLLEFRLLQESTNSDALTPQVKEEGCNNWPLTHPNPLDMLPELMAWLANGLKGRLLVYVTELPTEGFLIEKLRHHHTIVPAAGGVVSNEAGEVLLIYRRNRWDLPKGKIEPGEQTEQAAVREVEEETGIHNLELGKPLATSFHTYFTKPEGFVVKPTYWFEMRVQGKPLPTPQEEEAIEEARWVPKENLPAYLEKTYASIREALKAYLDKYPR